MSGAKRLIAGQNDWFQNIPKALFTQFYHLLIKLKINGIAYLQNHKALIIAINHKTGVDPIAVQAVLKRRIFFATDGLWFKNWLVDYSMVSFATESRFIMGREWKICRV